MQKFYKFLFFSCLVLSLSCSKERKTPADYVNPKIGTGGHGHTFPGASLPFGMVQLSPDTRIDDWDGCSGYHCSDNSILGFSHTHLSGTGCGDYGDIRFMPLVGNVQINPGEKENTKTGYRSLFDKESEIAEPGYYSVKLTDYNVKAELTTTLRTGLHAYTFPESKESRIILDLKEAIRTEDIHDSELIIVNDSEIAGMRRTGAWAKDHPVYFYAVFSRPFESSSIYSDGQKLKKEKEARGKNLKASFTFNTYDQERILVKVGISAVSIDGAYKNLKQENPNWNFEEIRIKAKNEWNKRLSKIQVSSENDSLKTVFYTALYHMYLSPNIFNDFDGRFYGHDGNVHQDKDRNQYTVFSLWDTFRAQHPLMSYLEPQATQDMINTMLNIYSLGDKLPVWELAGNETGCMIGYHSVPVIYDAYVKGIRGFDLEKAYEAMKHSAKKKELGIEYLDEFGYVPGDKSGASVSKTLEYAYDDWCIAQFAKKLGKNADYKYFMERAQNYKNIFDKKTGFMRGKRNGGFVKPFDPNEVTFMLTEANSWQYTFFAPQDISGLIELYGGKDGFEKKLDAMFGAKTVLSGRHQPDISGLIGQYAHGNEPSHHMAYLYDYIGKPWKTQKLVHQICNEMYSCNVDGYSGNEDCGQMSAWYVFSSMGLYSVTPGDTVLAIGSPLFDKVVLTLDNGNEFELRCKNISRENCYIQKAYLNGEPYNKTYISVLEIPKGGVLEFEMGSEPNKKWGSKDGDYPVTSIDEYPIISIPNIDAVSRSFKNKLDVKLTHNDLEAIVYYTLDGTTPNEKSQKFSVKKPIVVKKTTTIKAIAMKNGMLSKCAQATFYAMPANWEINIINPYGKQYTAGGNEALIDGIKGNNNFTTGDWQGYWDTDMVVEIDMGKRKYINSISTGFLQATGAWIWMPKEVIYEVSDNGKKWRKYASLKSDVSLKEEGIIKDFSSSKKKIRARYVRVTAKPIDSCPSWHSGRGKPAWIFADEICIQ
ncbi:MAG: GH92 family glycosyl hydrolase [Bacteroidales bacterium]